MSNGPLGENCGDSEYERLLQSDEDTRELNMSSQELNDDGSAEVCDWRPVEIGQKASYGLGHVFNDIAATIWFSYTMVFMQDVVGMPPTTAGFLLFFG